MSWQVYALWGAFFAALTGILGKLGVEKVDSNLATAVRTVVILIFAWAIVAVQGTYRELGQAPARAYWFLVLSGITTGLSWLCYFRALSLADASRVGPLDKLSLALTVVLAAVVLREKMNREIVIGTLLMTAGAVVIAMGQGGAGAHK